MDSQVPRDAHILIDVVDDAWLTEKEPTFEVFVPLHEIPGPEPCVGGDPDDANDNAIRDRENRWDDNGEDRLIAFRPDRIEPIPNRVPHSQQQRNNV